MNPTAAAAACAAVPSTHKTTPSRKIQPQTKEARKVADYVNRSLWLYKRMFTNLKQGFLAALGTHSEEPANERAKSSEQLTNERAKSSEQLAKET